MLSLHDTILQKFNDAYTSGNMEEFERLTLENCYSPMMYEYINSCKSLYHSSQTFSVPRLTTITVNSANSSWWYDVWDTKIDLFFKVFNADNQLVFVSETKSDVTLPVSFILSIPIQSGYKIEFYDEDMTTNSYGGTVTISTDVPGTYSWSNANTTSGSVTISHGYSEYADIHWGMQKTWDFYKSKLNRTSFDNRGHVIYNIAFPPNDDKVFSTMPTNAFAQGNYEPYFMAYGDGDGTTMSPVVSLDVMAHEFTHLVTSQNGHGGLDYMNESGALNESFSDIFAMGVKKYVYGVSNWAIGEDVMLQEPFMRSMKNPNAAKQPDTYGNQAAFWIPSTTTPDKEKNDNGGVHTNSGVQNFWFYLLCEGGSGTNDNNTTYSVTGIGMDKALKIVYLNLVQYLTPSATHADARLGAILSAQELYGVGSAEEIAVTNAWHAVGVGDKYPEDITIKATMPASWGNTISAWVWQDGSNGSWVTLIKQGDWYSYSKSCDKLNIIFVNGATWSEDNNQTVDISTSSSICCQISDNKTGKRNYTIVDCEENDDTQQFIVLAQRNINSNWFYMTADLGTAGTKRFQAIDAGTSNKSMINTSPTDTKYIWSFEEVDGGVALVNGEQYASWKSGNSAILSAIPMALNITDISEDQVNMSFVDGEGNTRYLSLNATEGNNYFAFYKGTTQKCNLLIIPYGEKIVADVQSNISIETSSVQKLLRNGQLLILLDGKTYNAQGALIK